MAKRVSVSKAHARRQGGGKTPVKSTPRRRKPPAATRDSLIAAAATVLDEADRLLQTERHSLDWHWPKGRLGGLRGQLDDIVQRFGEVTDKDASYGSARQLLSEALQASPGTVPTLARPGMWVEWIGYVPVLCVSGGFVTRQFSFHAADPAEKWIGPTGYRSVYAAVRIGQLDAGKILRAELEEIVSDRGFRLADLERGVRDRLVKQLAGAPWLQAILARGPVKPIPLPRRFDAVQASLFQMM